MTMVRKSSPRLQRLQRGITTVMAVVLLIAVVIYVLGQTLNITASGGIDTLRQLDSAGALFQAESGLERAAGVMREAVSSGTNDNTTCTSLATGTNSFVVSSAGSGTFTYVAATSTPTTCSGKACTYCTVQVRGTVGSAQRTIQERISLVPSNGSTGFGAAVSLSLTNTDTVTATAIFNLAWQANGTTATVCGSAGCSPVWNESTSGANAIGGMGTVYNIGPLSTGGVTQTLSGNNYFSEVGALFPGLSGSPTVVAGFWNDTKSHGPQANIGLTAVGSGDSGTTNSGVATSPGGSGCNAPSNTTPNSSGQPCSSWCYGADTLVVGLSARSTTVTQEVTALTFNTTGTPTQNVSMTRVVHFPNTDGTITNASGTTYSEIWWAYNPDYMSSSAGVGTISYPGGVQGIVGATINLGAQIKKTDTTMLVSSLTDSNARLCVGDLLQNSAGDFAAGTTIDSTASEPIGWCGTAATVANRTLKLSASPTNPVGAGNQVTASSKSLFVFAQSGANLVVGATNTVGVSIQSVPPATGTSTTYALSAAAWVPATTVITQGLSGSTISVPTGTALPTVGTRVSVYSGTGSLPAGATVTAVATNAFTVSSAPTTPLAGAAVCGGICAFFDQPSSTTATTQFDITRTHTGDWTAGFVCLKGVDKSKIVPIPGSSSSRNTWQEVVN